MESKKIITPARVMCFLAFVVLVAASVMSYNHTPKQVPVLPKPEYTVFCINVITAVFCGILVFFPHNWKCQCSILLIQSISTALTGYEVLGTFLYAALSILLFVNGFFKTHIKEKIHIIGFIWAFVMVGYGVFCIRNEDSLHKGVQRMLLEITISVFFFGFYYYVYKKLEALLVTLVPAKPVINPDLNLPKIGSELKLSNYGLTERQVNLVLEYLSTQNNYEALGEKFFISKSTVKKDMTEVFNKFGVCNLKDLHILLLQYIVVA